MPIDFTLTPEQQELQRSARAFAETVLVSVAEKVEAATDPSGAFQATRGAFAEMARAGFTKGFIPKELGGLGLGMIDFAIAAEELVRVDINVPTTLLASGVALQTILHGGTSEQRRRFVTPFAEDDDGSLLAAIALTEPGGGANYDTEDPAAGIQTIARREGDQWVIRGEKVHTTNGAGWDGNGAHTYSVVCRTDPGRPARESLAVVIVPGSSPGVIVAGVDRLLGHHGTMSARMAFDDVRVPVDHMIGRPGEGLRIVTGAFAWSAALIGAACAGTMRRAFEYALDFAKSERRLGSKPILEHQNVGFMLADVKMKLEAARYLTWKACHYMEETGGHELAFQTKVFCSELAVQAVYDAMRVVGVESYTKRTPLERLMRDALVFPIYDGSNMGVRRRQLHSMMSKPGYDSMLTAEGRVPPWMAG